MVEYSGCLGVFGVTLRCQVRLDALLGIDPLNMEGRQIVRLRFSLLINWYCYPTKHSSNILLVFLTGTEGRVWDVVL
jgi:hypothetical protein